MHILLLIFFAPLALFLGISLVRNLKGIFWALMIIIFTLPLLFLMAMSQPSHQATVASTVIRLNHDNRPVEPRAFEIDNLHHYTPGETVTGHPAVNP